MCCLSPFLLAHVTAVLGGMHIISFDRQDRPPTDVTPLLDTLRERLEGRSAHRTGGLFVIKFRRHCLCPRHVYLLIYIGVVIVDPLANSASRFRKCAFSRFESYVRELYILLAYLGISRALLSVRSVSNVTGTNRVLRVVE